TTSSRSPTKLSQAIHIEPSGAEAMAGQSSCRNWCPTAVAVISAQTGAIEMTNRTAVGKNSGMGTLYDAQAARYNPACRAADGIWSTWAWEAASGGYMERDD